MKIFSNIQGLDAVGNSWDILNAIWVIYIF